MYRLTRRTALWSFVLVVFLVLVLLFACRQDDNSDSPPEVQQVETTVEVPPDDTPPPGASTISHTPCVASFGANSILGSTPQTEGAGFPYPDDTDYGIAGPGYFANQLIVTGTPTEVDNLMAGASGLAPGQNPLVSLGFVDELGQSVVAALFRLDSGVNPVAKALEVNTLADADGVFVRAEPNYILSNPQRRFDTDGFPGSPGIEGAPGSPGIEGAGGTNPVSAQFNVSQFESQWAFDSVVPFDSSYVDLSGGQTYISPPGIDLAIFDSSPLSTDSYYGNALCIYALLEQFGPTLPTPNFADNHGLFAASLAGPLAHEGNIHLVQVLKAAENGALQGDLFTLLGAIQVYDEQIGAIRQARMVDLYGEPQVAHTIINLSLGFALNPAADDIGPLMNSLRDTGNTALPAYLNTEHGAQVEGGEFQVELPVVSLRVMLGRLEATGYVVVAAAGNDGLELPQTPAAYPEVIGVEALNIEGGRSCFSNRGNISAPGGGPPDIPPPGEDNDPATPLLQEDLDRLCLPEGQEPDSEHPIDLTGCLANPNCNEAITGHIRSSSATDGLGYWVGTSFAAPLVSGLAQSAAEYGLSQGYNLTSAEVRTAVYCTANGNPQSDPSPLASLPSAGQVDSALLEQCVDDVFNARP